MSKREISSLLEDIDKVFIQGKAPSEANLTLLTEGISAELVKALSEEYVSAGRMRLSAIGKKDRQLWYDYNGYDKEPLSTATRIKFLLGHIIEELTLFLVREAGHEVTMCQEEVKVNGVKGHIDAMIDGELVDVKSASPYGFRKFHNGSLKNDDPFGYIYQISSYAKALKKDAGYFLAVDKSNGFMTLLKTDVTDVNPEERIDQLRKTLSDKEPPEKCYQPTEEANGNKKLAIGCKFCDFKKICWEDSNDGFGLRKFKYASGDEYYTHVEKEPRVREDF
jgi:hypothetical protein|tara:strand:- start:1556 stop:2392 length:837 start_codon:yes stop_codon:yes gene_type:complete